MTEDLDPIAEELPSGRERDLDMLIAMELASGSPAAARLWAASGLDVVVPAAVMLQVPRRDGRTTDVVATVEGRSLLIEDKLPGGQYEPGQPNSYRVHRSDTVRCLTVAPASFRPQFDKWSHCFDGFVSLETLTTALRTAADVAGPSHELSAGYQWRAARYELLASSLVPPAIDAVVAFGRAYQALANELAEGVVRLSSNSFRRGGRAMFERDAPAPAPFVIIHKLPRGYVDVIFRGWTKAGLDDLWSSVEPDELPDGWEVAEQDNARTQSKVGEPAPVLRHHVARKVRPLEDSFDNVRDVVHDALSAMIDISRWLATTRPTPGWQTDGTLVNRLLARAAANAVATNDPLAAQINALLAPADDSEGPTTERSRTD